MEELDENTLVIDKEELKDFSAEELVDLKIELNDLLARIDELIEQCNEEL